MRHGTRNHGPLALFESLLDISLGLQQLLILLLGEDANVVAEAVEAVRERGAGGGGAEHLAPFVADLGPGTVLFGDVSAAERFLD